MYAWKKSAILICILGCGDSEESPKMQDQVGCDIMILEMSPGDNASGIDHDLSPQILFSQPVADREWTLEMDGVPGQATLGDDGKSATFIPDAPLSPNTTYTLTGGVCDRTRTTQFSTLGASVDPDSLSGRVYGVPFSIATWEEPAAWGDIVGLLGLNLPSHLLVKVTDVQEGAPILHGAFTARDTQEQSPCDPVIPFGAADLSLNPLLSSPTSAAQISLEWYGALDFESLKLSGELLDKGDTLGHIILEGFIDSRALQLEGEDGPYTACETTYVDCVPCVDGLEQCIPIHIETDTAPWWPEASLDEHFEPASKMDCWG